jgi:hypothetical protein
MFYFSILKYTHILDQNLSALDCICMLLLLALNLLAKNGERDKMTPFDLNYTVMISATFFLTLTNIMLPFCINRFVTCQYMLLRARGWTTL